MVEQKQLLFLDNLNEETRRKWLGYWSLHHHAAWRQHPGYGEVAKACGETPVFVVGLANEEIKLAGLFSLRRLGFGATEAVCLRGPVFDDVSFANWCLPQIHDFFRQRNAGTVRIGPYWRFPEAEDLERALFDMGYQRFEKEQALGRRATGMVDLQGSDEDLLKSFRQSTRYEIKHARKLDVQLRIATSVDEAMEFFDHLDQRDKERGIGRASRVESLAISACLTSEPDSGAIISAYHEDSFLGGLMVARGGTTAFTVKFVVSEHCKCHFPTLRIAPAVFFSGMLWAKSHGCQWVDLEGYSSNDLNQGDKAFVNRYKAGFRPVECQALGQYFVICNPSMHRIQRVVSLGVRVTRWPRRLAHRVRFELKKWRVARRDHRNVQPLN